MREPKRSLSFSVDDTQIRMIRELEHITREKRSSLLRTWVLKAYNAQVGTKVGPAHTAPFEGRIWHRHEVTKEWYTDKNKTGGMCNPNMMCFVCGGEEE